MSKSAQRVWQFYVGDMIRSAEKVLKYTSGLSQNEFELNSLIYDATLRNLELIGESATHIPPDIRVLNSQIAWREIIALRNQLIHGYLGIDNDTIWSIVQNNIPILIPQLESISSSVEGGR